MPKYRDPKKIYLSKDQVELIDSKMSESDCPPELKLAGTWFVIACYLGFRFGDAQAFDKKKNIRDERIILHTKKTGEIVSLPLMDKIKTLLDSIGYKNLYISNTHTNRLLKTIKTICEIEENISFHTARHTCAIMLANMGVSQEVTANILGHNSLKTTAIYYKITNLRIDSEYSKIF